MNAPSAMSASSLFDLHDRTAVVTGAMGLLGKEHCRALASAGARIVATDLDTGSALSFAEELRARGASGVLMMDADVTSPESLLALRDAALEQFGALDVLVNNAAIDDKVELPATALEESRFEQYALRRWRRALDVNVTGVFLASQILGTEMAKAGRGSIVNVASTYGVVAPDQALYRTPQGEQTFFKSPVYPTSKGAVLSFTRYLAAYWGDAGVRVNALSPGGVQNGQDAHFVASYSSRTLLGRMARPDDYRGALLFLASDASAYVTGTNLIVDGGWTAK
ncbi:SDR family oxidoreductase [Pendulispora albinea]|uniref:SDR family oxidoreductase n=1 Tax=Pendulispora albinea TaxID=2741071 RepID=A0ABZ2M7X3_9BACT